MRRGGRDEVPTPSVCVPPHGWKSGTFFALNAAHHFTLSLSRFSASSPPLPRSKGAKRQVNSLKRTNLFRHFLRVRTAYVKRFAPRTDRLYGTFWHRHRGPKRFTGVVVICGANKAEQNQKKNMTFRWKCWGRDFGRDFSAFFVCSAHVLLLVRILDSHSTVTRGTGHGIPTHDDMTGFGFWGQLFRFRVWLFRRWKNAVYCTFSTVVVANRSRFVVCILGSWSRWVCVCDEETIGTAQKVPKKC